MEETNNPLEKKLSKKKVRNGENKSGSKELNIVGLGASAGGLKALERFFTNSNGIEYTAFIVIQHMDPKSKSELPQILSRYTSLKVNIAREGAEIEAGNVYINPPAFKVGIENNKIHLETITKTSGISLPIDYFFRSLSADKKDKAIAVVLSGTGSDGTGGIKEIKANGGMVLVQDPGQAAFPDMPQNAIDTGLVDMILKAEEIPLSIARFIHNPVDFIEIQKHAQNLETERELYSIMMLVKSISGHDFSGYKESTIIRRIERRMSLKHILKLKDYAEYIRNNENEGIILFKEMLISVTSFFRDKEEFEFLKKEILPQIIKRKKNNEIIRVWVAGCATGEEAYSVAILFYELFEEMKVNLDLQIFATDLDENAIDVARKATYNEGITENINRDRLEKFLTRSGNTYSMKKNIRERVIFASHNAIKDPPFLNVDLMVCRNLLIYLNSNLQKALISIFHYSLARNGYLFLGTAESLEGYRNHFKQIKYGSKIFKRLEGDKFHQLHISEPVEIIKNKQSEEAASHSVEVPADFIEQTNEILLQDYSYPAVVIDESNGVVYFTGDLSPFMSLPAGKATFDLFEITTKEVINKLRRGIRHTRKQKTPVRLSNIKLKQGKLVKVFEIILRPFILKQENKEYILIIFKETGNIKVKKESGNKLPFDIETHIASLEDELKSANENLQNTIENSRNSEEELQSVNEEMQAKNEELQSTNEELETSKEEVKSTNEELITVNTELKERLLELSNANNDIKNLLASTEIATLFLDQKLRIKRFTPKTKQIFSLLDSDIGRPITDLSSRLNYDDIEKDALHVLDTLEIISSEKQDLNKNWYNIRIIPYRTLDNIIDGVVITFVDFTNLRSMKRLSTVVEDSYNPITLMDLQGNYTAWNKGAERMYGYTEEQALKMNILDLVPDSEKANTKNLLKNSIQGKLNNPIITKRISIDQKELDVLLTITCLKNEQGKITELATTEQILSELNKLEKK